MIDKQPPDIRIRGLACFFRAGDCTECPEEFSTVSVKMIQFADNDRSLSDTKGSILMFIAVFRLPETVTVSSHSVTSM